MHYPESNTKDVERLYWPPSPLLESHLLANKPLCKQWFEQSSHRPEGRQDSEAAGM